MSNIKTQIRKLVFKLRKDYFNLNNVVLVIALLFCASWVWASINTMTKNWELETKLEARQLAQEKLKLEIENLRLEQEYFQTAEYQELTARAKLNKKYEDETMVVLPDNSKQAKEKYQTSKPKLQRTVSNIESWISFLFPDN